MLEHRVGQPLAREEEQTEADADRRLDRRQADAEREAVPVGDPVREERESDGGLQEADVSRPEREDRGHVHQQEDEPGRGERLLDLECPHRGPHGEELERPAESLEAERNRRGERRAHDPESLTGHQDDASYRAEMSDRPCAPRASRARHRDREERRPQHHDRAETRDRPAGIRAVPSTKRISSTTAMRSKTRCATTEPTSVPQASPRGCETRRVSTPTRASSPTRPGSRVREEPDREGGEDRAEARVRRRHRVVDDRSPSERADDDRDEVERDRSDHPFPDDEGEGVGDEIRRRPRHTISATATAASATKAPKRHQNPRERATLTRAPAREPVGRRGAGRWLRAGRRSRPTRSARSRGRRAAAPRARRRGSSSRTAISACTGARGSPGGIATDVSGVVTSR